MTRVSTAKARPSATIPSPEDRGCNSEVFAARPPRNKPCDRWVKEIVNQIGPKTESAQNLFYADLLDFLWKGDGFSRLKADTSAESVKEKFRQFRHNRYRQKAPNGSLLNMLHRFSQALQEQKDNDGSLAFSWDKHKSFAFALNASSPMPTQEEESVMLDICSTGRFRPGLDAASVYRASETGNYKTGRRKHGPRNRELLTFARELAEFLAKESGRERFITKKVLRQALVVCYPNLKYPLDALESAMGPDGEDASAPAYGQADPLAERACFSPETDFSQELISDTSRAMDFFISLLSPEDKLYLWSLGVNDGGLTEQDIQRTLDECRLALEKDDENRRELKRASEKSADLICGSDTREEEVRKDRLKGEVLPPPRRKLLEDSVKILESGQIQGKMSKCTLKHLLGLSSQNRISEQQEQAFLLFRKFLCLSGTADRGKSLPSECARCPERCRLNMSWEKKLERIRLAFAQNNNPLPRHVPENENIAEHYRTLCWTMLTKKLSSRPVTDALL
ncbi:hypothetical protein [uncultured Mailhella sp.]|uniref:hypothetical protein n=1 Tax=uncultured Mailhella sp. TaxID=1981031 RepID=UPI00320AD029